MKQVVSLLLFVVTTCVVKADELATLQGEFERFRSARSAIWDNAGLSQFDKLGKIFKDETIKGLYNKYSASASQTWESFIADPEKEVKTVGRKYKLPQYSPGADESMIDIIEPTVAQLTKEYEGLGKNDPKRKELKKRIDDLQAKLNNHKKQAAEEKQKWEKKVEKIVAERDGALAKTVEKVNGELDAFAELHYLGPINRFKEQAAQVRREQVAKKKAEAKRAEALKKAQDEAMRQNMEPAYRKAKAWYDEQLRYNDLSESFYSLNAYSAEHEEAQLDLHGSDGTYQIYLGDGYINYPRSMAKGFAEDLVNARTIIHKYEHPNWFEESQKKIKQWEHEIAEEKRAEAQKRAKRSSAAEGSARSRMGEPRQKCKSGGRNINPNLKRFKGPND